ncbi:MAG: class I SAM-dependent methyltransferase [Solirubrobacteraceae bacterium]
MLFEDRSRAESFGNVAQLYDRARPTYPPELVDWLLSDGSRRVLDVGCGTGIAGAPFAARGCKVTGVEIDGWPRSRERRASRWRLRASSNGMTGEDGSSSRSRPRRGTGSSLARALRRRPRCCQHRGRIGCFWNLGDPPAEVRERLEPIYDRLGPKAQNLSVVLGKSGGGGEDTAAALNDSELFEPAEMRRFKWSRTYTTDEWLQLIATHSDHQALGERRLGALLDAVGSEIDALGGAFEYPYETVLVTAQVCSASQG